MNIIFDFDGVILNSHKTKTLAFYNIFKVYGKNIAQQAQKFHLNNTGKSRYIKFKFIFKNILKSKLSKKERIILDKKFDQFVEEKIEKLSPSNYLLNFLKSKKSKNKFFISTGTPQKKMITILKKKKLFKYFEKVYGSPTKKIEHIKKIKSNKKKCVFIGDSLEDLKAAKHSKIDFILKLNSENFYFRRKITINTINSFKYLEKKIQFIN